jgi:8-oxo-dGTP diphosphatase
MAEKDFSAGLPRKRMAAGALFLDDARRVLIVKPTYRAEWLVPGGVVEEDESPRAACAREIREELGLPLEPGRLLCVEYRSAHDRRTECVQFIFLGGVLSPGTIAQITLPQAELTDYRFVASAEAAVMLAPRLAPRIALALTALADGRTIYAEDGAESLGWV